jgi:hypothetical protein
MTYIYIYTHFQIGDQHNVCLQDFKPIYQVISAITSHKNYIIRNKSQQSIKSTRQEQGRKTRNSPGTQYIRNIHRGASTTQAILEKGFRILHIRLIYCVLGNLNIQLY